MLGDTSISEQPIASVTAPLSPFVIPSGDWLIIARRRRRR
jgi:hypothetical protein